MQWTGRLEALYPQEGGRPDKQKRMEDDEIVQRGKEPHTGEGWKVNRSKDKNHTCKQEKSCKLPAPPSKKIRFASKDEEKEPTK